jgi:hypothetical protein
LQEIPRKMVRESARGTTLAGLRLATRIAARAPTFLPGSETVSGLREKISPLVLIASPLAAPAVARATIVSKPALDEATILVREIVAKPRSENFFAVIGSLPRPIRCASA